MSKFVLAMGKVANLFGVELTKDLVAAFDEMLEGYTDEEKATGLLRAAKKCSFRPVPRDVIEEIRAMKKDKSLLEYTGIQETTPEDDQKASELMPLFSKWRRGEISSEEWIAEMEKRGIDVQALEIGGDDEPEDAA